MTAFIVPLLIVFWACFLQDGSFRNKTAVISAETRGDKENTSVYSLQHQKRFDQIITNSDISIISAILTGLMVQAFSLSNTINKALIQ